MSNPNDPMQVRIQNLYKDVLGELRNKIDNIENVGRNFENKIMNLQKRLFSVMKTNCRSEYEWIERNGKIMEKDGGLQIEINEESKAEGQRHLDEFKECADKSSFGLRGYFDDMNVSQNRLYSDNEKCMASCVEKIDEKSDEHLKRCIKSCFNNTFDGVQKIYNDVEEKLDDISRKI